MPSSRVFGGRLDQLVQQAGEPVFWLSAELRLLWVNRAWEDLTGHSAESVLGVACLAHGPPRDGTLPGACGSFHPPPEVLEGRPAGTRTLIVQPSGERLWRRIEFWPFHNDKLEVSAILGLVRPGDEPALLPDSDGHRLRVDLLEARERLVARHGGDALIGRGPAHRRLLDQIATAANATAAVLLVGETGSGRRHLARMIHQQGTARQFALISLDCAALPPEVLKRELFGTVGDGTPSTTRIALPTGKTLLIGDVLDLTRDIQARLAHALETPTKLIAVTSRDPEAAMQADLLRADLYYALTALVIRLSPLRDRLDELPLLAQHFLERANLRGARQRTRFSDEAVDTLLGYDWPGNLRELARVVDDAHGRGKRDTVEVDDLPAAIRGHLGAAYTPPPPPRPLTPLDELLTEVERRLIEKALERSRHNKSRAAELLGISRPRLYRRIKELGLPDEPESTEAAAVSPDGRP